MGCCASTYLGEERMPKIVVSITKTAGELEIAGEARERIEALGDVVWNKKDQKLEGDA